MADVTTLEFKVKPESSEIFDNELAPKVEETGAKLIKRTQTIFGYERVIYDGELMDGTFQELESKVKECCPTAKIDFDSEGGMDGDEEVFYAEM